MGISTTDRGSSPTAKNKDTKGFASVSEQESSERLPREPLIVIEPTGFWSALELRQIWIHRELLYFLVWRDLKVRYKQTALGVAWVLLQPFLMTMVFTVVFGALVRVPTTNVPYPLFAYSGLLLWIFFSGAISMTGNSLVGNANLITKVYFPRLILPVATIIARLVDLGVVLIILVPLMFYYKVAATTHLLIAPIPILLIACLALGFGLWTSAVNVKYRDVGLALPVLIQLWMFASPVVYGLNAIPKKWQLAFSLNPLTGIMEMFRAALFGLDFNWMPILISVGYTLFFLVYGAFAFQRRQKTFADIV